MDLVLKAINFAGQAHAGQLRKSTNIPYITHPYSVGMLLLKAGCPEDLIVAGILHDVVEDTVIKLEDIKGEFNENIARIVEGCSEQDKTLEWEERKQHTIDYLRTASKDVKYVACADKLHNLISIHESLLLDEEDQVWSRFKRGKYKQGWYYRNVLASIKWGLNEEFSLVNQLDNYIDEVFGDSWR